MTCVCTGDSVNCTLSYWLVALQSIHNSTFDGNIALLEYQPMSLESFAVECIIWSKDMQNPETSRRRQVENQQRMAEIVVICKHLYGFSQPLFYNVFFSYHFGCMKTLIF